MTYLRTIEHATSVKKISIIREPTATEYGIADFEFRPVFSVFDYGTIEPPVPLDNSTVNLMLGFNFEILKEHGVESHYFSLVTKEGEEISAKDAVLRGIAPTIARFKYVNRVMPEFIEGEGRWDYSMFENPENNNYVHPIEFISRNDLPEASSVWKRVRKGTLTLKDLGLPEDFKQGDSVPANLIPLLDYSTKFEPDDRYLTPGQAKQLLGISDERFSGINATTIKASKEMTAYAMSRGFERDDGKVEYITLVEGGIQKDILGDAVCTWHEDRLTVYGLGISKQRIRDEVKILNPKWYEDIEKAKEQAKKEGKKDFRDLMDRSIVYISPSPEFFEAINTLFRAGINQWVGARVYRLYQGKRETLEDNLARAVEEFERLKAA